MSKALTVTQKLFFDDTGMDRTRVQGIVDRELAGSDEGELYLERTLSESFSLSELRVKSSFEIDQGFGIRYTSGEKTAFRPNAMLTEAAILREAHTVRAVRNQAEGTISVPAALIIAPRATPLYIEESPLLGYTAAEKKKLIQDINAYVRGKDSRVREVNVSLTTEYKCVEIIRPGQAPIADIRPLVRMDVTTMLRDGKRRESGHYGFGGRTDCGLVFNEAAWKHAADEAVKQAQTLMRATPAAAGEMTVVIGAGWPGVLLHEAVGHGLEGDFNRKETSAFSGLIGQRVAAPGITIVDQGDIADRRGSLNFDDEGTRTQRNVLIEDGILVGYMQDRMNARLMGVSATGNGRRESWEHAPMPRMTNTFAESGKQTPEEIIASVKKGLYAPTFGGGSVDITSGKFNFGMTEAYPIENGKILYDRPVKGALLVGSGPDVIRNKITMVGNDSCLDSGIGTCGKDGQGVPAGVGQPTFRVDGITVGGRSGPK